MGCLLSEFGIVGSDGERLTKILQTLNINSLQDAGLIQPDLWAETAQALQETGLSVGSRSKFWRLAAAARVLLGPEHDSNWLSARLGLSKTPAGSYLGRTHLGGSGRRLGITSRYLQEGHQEENPESVHVSTSSETVALILTLVRHIRL
jgi:hypothetical protein